MWIASLKPEDIDGAVKIIVAFIGGLVSIIVAVGAAVAAIRTVIRGEKKRAPVSDIERQVKDEVVQGLPISIEQMELEDTIRTRKRLERAIALLAKHGIDYEDYLDGKELKP